MVLGSARSGTTLVQRLCCEISGVGVPPETHFFELFVSDLLARRAFPLSQKELREEVGRFLDLETSKGMSIDPDRLDRPCRSAFELFEIIVSALAPEARVLGEKTPGHTLWWKPIRSAAPAMKFVAVVRDPRAVVASSLSMPWASNEDLNSIKGEVHLGVAARWRVDQQALSELRQAVGPERSLFLRYEDVVNDPAAARQRIAELLGLDVSSGSDSPAAPGIVLDWEPWKAQALEDVTEDRVSLPWSESLSRKQAQEIQAVCWRAMADNGYLSGRAGPLFGAMRLDRFARRDVDTFLKRYDDYRRWIESMNFGPAT
jgi:hypothetical protein